MCVLLEYFACVVEMHRISFLYCCPESMSNFGTVLIDVLSSADTHYSSCILTVHYFVLLPLLGIHIVTEYVNSGLIHASNFSTIRLCNSTCV